MNEFPDFMKSPANLIGKSSQYTDEQGDLKGKFIPIQKPGKNSPKYSNRLKIAVFRKGHTKLTFIWAAAHARLAEHEFH